MSYIEMVWAIHRNGWVQHLWVREKGEKGAKSMCGDYYGTTEDYLTMSPNAKKCETCMKIARKRGVA